MIRLFIKKVKWQTWLNKKVEIKKLVKAVTNFFTLTIGQQRG